MKKGEKCIATIEKVNFPNKGIAMVDGKTCVIKNAIPGQKVEIQITKKRSDRYEGMITNVIERAPEEIESPCPMFGTCGGCTYLSLPYEEQLKVKENQVKKLLDGALQNQDAEWKFEGAKTSPCEYEYRNKMEFSFGDSEKNGPLRLGMHRRGSFYDVVDVDCCQIVDEDFRSILKVTKDVFKDIPYLHRLSHEGYLRHLLVRKAAFTGEILVALVTSSQTQNIDEDALLNTWRKEILNINLTNQDDRATESKITGVLHIVNDSLADVVQADRIDILFGRDYINEKLLGLSFKISVFSFFQTNSRGAEVLYDTARSYIGDIRTESGEKATVFDLYSGTGTIAQLMAPVSKKVIGVEIVEEAVEAAKENAKLNGLDNCEFIANDVLLALDDINEKPDFIILDPPRDGVNPKALKKIIDYGVERMVYISCKPTSLVRDLEMLLMSGYRVEKACCVDMFPFTANIETIALVSRGTSRPAKDYIKVGIDAEEYYKIKNEG